MLLFCVRIRVSILRCESFVDDFGLFSWCKFFKFCFGLLIGVVFVYIIFKRVIMIAFF